MKVEMSGTQKSAMPLSFSNFNFLLIYKAESAGSQTYPFLYTCMILSRKWRLAHFSKFCFIIHAEIQYYQTLWLWKLH